MPFNLISSSCTLFHFRVRTGKAEINVNKVHQKKNVNKVLTFDCLAVTLFMQVNELYIFVKVTGTQHSNSRPLSSSDLLF